MCLRGDFYRSLALGYPLEAAVSEGRRGIYLEADDRADWGIPVLFLRSPDGMLFTDTTNLGAADVRSTAATPASQAGTTGVSGDVHITSAASLHLQEPVAPPPAPLPLPSVEGFVGRVRELAVYAEALRTTGHAVITGMPGVGKTALAAKLALSVAAPDKIFWHTFHAHEGLDTLLWELAGFVAWNDNDQLWQLLQRSSQPPPPETLVMSLLQAISGQNYLLCLDDIQFMDDDPAFEISIDRITGAFGASGLRLIATADRVPAVEGLVHWEPLGGMGLEDVRRFLVARNVTLSDLLSAELHAKTGGNVQLLSLAAHVLQGTTDPARVISQLAHADNIAYYLLDEVDKGLDEAKRRVMTALAVLGGIQSRAAAVEAVLDGENPRRTLLTLISRYLVTSQMGVIEQEYSIHSTLQSFYYDGLGQRERQIMHARAGVYYEQRERAYLRAASHFWNAGELSHAAQLATVHVRRLINQGQARPLRSLLESFDEAQLQPLEWVQVKLAQAQVCRILGDGAATQAACQEALGTLDGMENTPELNVFRAKTCREMGLALKYERPREALSWFERGLARLAIAQATTGEAHVDREEEGLLQLHVGGVQISLGNYEAALQATLTALENISPRESALFAYSYHNLGNIYSVQGDFAKAAHYNQLSLDISRRLHDDLNVVAVLNNMGIDKEISGDWPGAAADYEEALRIADQLDSVVDRVRIANALAMLEVRRGEDAAAEQTLLQAIEIARSHAIGEGLVYLLHTQADLELSRRHWDAAEHALYEAEHMARDLDTRYVLSEVLCSQAELALERGAADQALACVQRARQLAEELELGLENGKALRVLAQIQMMQGDKLIALESFAQSTLLVADEPYEVARCKAAWGAALLADGDQQGYRLLDEAAETFSNLGAQRDVQRIATLLQPMGEGGDEVVTDSGTKQ